MLNALSSIAARLALLLCVVQLALGCAPAPKAQEKEPKHESGARQNLQHIDWLKGSWLRGDWTSLPRPGSFPGYSPRPGTRHERFAKHQGDPRESLYLVWHLPNAQRGVPSLTAIIPARPLGGCGPGLGHPALFGPTADVVLQLGPLAALYLTPPTDTASYRAFLERYPIAPQLDPMDAPQYQQDVPLWLLLGAEAGPYAPPPPLSPAAPATAKAQPARADSPRTLPLQQLPPSPAVLSDAEDEVQGNAKLLSLLRGLLETHPRILAAQAQLEAAGARREAARSGFFPELIAKFIGGHETTQALNEKADLMRNVGSLSAKQLVYDFGGVQGSADKAKAEEAATAARLEQTKQDVLLQGSQAYVNLLKARDQLRHAKISEQSVARLSGIQDALTKAGVGYSYEELQMKAQLNGAQANVTMAERALVQAMNAFRSVFGFVLAPAEIHLLTHTVAPARALPSNPAEAVQQSLRCNPKLEDLRRQRQARQHELNTVDAGYFPRLDAVSDIQRKENDQAVRGVQSETRIGLQANMNIYEGGRNTEQAKAIKAGITELRRTELDMGHSLELQAKNAWQNRITSARLQQLATQQANQLLGVLKGLETRRMSGEDIKVLALIIAERDYLSAKDQLTAARCDGQNAVFQLLGAMGLMTLEALGE